MEVSDHQYLYTTATPTRKVLMPIMFTRTRGDVKNVEILCMQKVSSVQERSINASLATSMDTFLAYVIKRNKFLSSLGNQTMCYKGEQYMLVTSPYKANQKICLLMMIIFAFKSRYSAPKLIGRRFPHHLTQSQTLHIA